MKIKMTKENLHFLAECIKIETVKESIGILESNKISYILEMDDRYIVEKFLNEISGTAATFGPIIVKIGYFVSKNIGKLTVALLAAMTAKVGQRTDTMIKQKQASKQKALDTAMKESFVMESEDIKADVAEVKEIGKLTKENQKNFSEMIKGGQYKKAIPYLKDMIKDLVKLMNKQRKYLGEHLFDLDKNFLLSVTLWLSIVSFGVVGAKILVPVGRRFLAFFGKGKGNKEESKKFGEKAKKYLMDVKEKSEK